MRFNLCVFIFLLGIWSGLIHSQSSPINYYDQDIIYGNELIQLTPDQIGELRQSVINTRINIGNQSSDFFSEDDIQYILSDSVSVEPTPNTTLSFQDMSLNIIYGARDMESQEATNEMQEFEFYDFE